MNAFLFVVSAHLLMIGLVGITKAKWRGLTLDERIATVAWFVVHFYLIGWAQALLWRAPA